MACTQTQREGDRNLNTDEFLKQWRSKTQDCLSSECIVDALDLTMKSASLDLVMNSVRALVTTNREIWERCRGRKITEAQTIKILKFSYEKAFVRTVTFACNSKSTKITTQLRIITKDFGSLPEIPDYLTNIISPPKEKDSVIPDYNAYLGKAAILHDNVLKPFLQNFQKHLEEVQVFLGSIEEWLLEAEQTTTFLNDLFSKELKVDSDSVITKCFGISSSLKNNDEICVKCFQPQSSHGMQRNGNLTCENGCEGRFFHSIHEELFNANKAGGTIDMTFDLTTEPGKEKLNALVDFLKKLESYEI